MIEDCAKGSLPDELRHALCSLLDEPCHAVWAGNKGKVDNSCKGFFCSLLDEYRHALCTLPDDSVTRYVVCLTNPVTRCGARSGGGHVKGLLSKPTFDDPVFLIWNYFVSSPSMICIGGLLKLPVC